MSIVKFNDYLNESKSEMNILDAITFVLKEEDRPLSMLEIWSKISELNLLSKLEFDRINNAIKDGKVVGVYSGYLDTLLSRSSVNTKRSDSNKKNLFEIVGSRPNMKYKLVNNEDKLTDSEHSNEIEVSLQQNTEQINNKEFLFDDIKKASSDIYNCLTNTSYLCNKLNNIDKSYFQEYLDFLRVGPVNDLRRDVATYLVDNNITPTILDEIIKKHKKEKPNQLRAWLNPYKILHPIINHEYKDFDDEMKILANEISKSNGGMKWKINNFNGPQNQGSENYWIAFYNKSLLSQANSLQLFISFKQGQCTYGIYKHDGSKYVVGPETYTNWKSFIDFISENIHYILEDIKSTEVASTETSTDLDESEVTNVYCVRGGRGNSDANLFLEGNFVGIGYDTIGFDIGIKTKEEIKQFLLIKYKDSKTSIPQYFQQIELFKKIKENDIILVPDNDGVNVGKVVSEIYLSDDEDYPNRLNIEWLEKVGKNKSVNLPKSVFEVKNFDIEEMDFIDDDSDDSDNSDIMSGDNYVENPFAQSICILAESGVGKSTTTMKLLEYKYKHISEIIIPTATTTSLLAQYSPAGKKYILSRLGNLILDARNNPSKIYTAVIDECHKSSTIEMINDELLQCISKDRNLGKRFISVDDEISDLYLEPFNRERHRYPLNKIGNTDNLEIPKNFGFIFISSKPDIITSNSDFFNRVTVKILKKWDDKIDSFDNDEYFITIKTNDFENRKILKKEGLEKFYENKI